MFDDDEFLIPIVRRSHGERFAASNRQNVFENFDSPFASKNVRSVLNNSFTNESFLDQPAQTTVQLISLYEKTLELASKNKINAKNAFEISFVERLPEILEVIAFDEKIDSIDHEPNFVKAGSLIDTSAKIYGFRVDALHTETQKLNGTFQHQNESNNSNQVETVEVNKKLVQRTKSKSNSFIVSDLSTISLSYEFDFHPLQPSTMCHWPGGVGFDSIYGDLVSQTMYSSSDFPSINGFINFNSRVNRQFDDNQTILDLTVKTNFDLLPLREMIKDDQEQNHFLSCQSLREFSFNEDSTNSYVETIDECSLIDSSSGETNAPDDGFSQIHSELRDDPEQFYFHQLLSTHTYPTTMISMELTRMPSRTSFVDQIPNLLRDKNSKSDYNFYDGSKLKLFAGPFLWKYKNLLDEKLEIDPICRKIFSNRSVSKRKFRINFLELNKRTTFRKLLNNSNFQRRKIDLKRKKSKNFHQLKTLRKIRPIDELCSLNNFPWWNLNSSLNFREKSFSFDSNEFETFLDEVPSVLDPIEYDFVRPIHYEKIEIDRNFSKIDVKKLQDQLVEKVEEKSRKSSSKVQFSDLIVELFDQGAISNEKDQIVSAFYCMLNNCHKNQWFIKSNSVHDDFSIENKIEQKFSPLIYSDKI